MYDIDAWLGDADTTWEQREALKAASDMVTARYHPDLEDSRVNALNGAAAVILGDATLESIAAEYHAARRVEREAMEALTGAMIAASADRTEADIARVAGVQRLTVRKALGK